MGTCGEIDPQSLGQGFGIGDRTGARIARRHGQAVHVIRTQGIDGDDGHERRIDATGQADHGVGEAVLLQVVACAQHECLIDLGVLVERRWHRRRRATEHRHEGHC